MIEDIKYNEFRKSFGKRIKDKVKDVDSKNIDFAQFSDILNAKNSINFIEGAENLFGLHYRVSTKKQVKDGDSLETQEEMANQVLKQENGKAYKVYLEDGLSATKKKLSQRPKMLDLLDDFQTGKFKNIISYNQDRLFRNDKEAPVILLYLIMNGVNIYYTRGRRIQLVNAETLGDYGILVILLDAIKAQKETEATSERVADNRYYKFLKGEITQSFLPYGYIKNKDKKVELIKEEVNMIKQVEDFYLNSIGIDTITKWLNGEKTKKLGKREAPFYRRKIRADDSEYWTKDTIKGLLFNKFYHGILVNNYRGKDYEEITSKEHEPIRTLERYNQIINFKNKKNENKLPAKHYNTDYLLSGILFCKDCGCHYRGHNTTKPNGKQYLYYECSNKHRSDGKKVCNNKAYTKILFEKFILLKVKNYLKKLDFSFFVEKLSSHLNENDEQKIADKNNLNSKYETLGKEYKGLQLQIRRKLSQIEDEDDVDFKQELEEEVSELEKEGRLLKKSLKEMKDIHYQLEKEIENEKEVKYEMEDIFIKMKEFIDKFDEAEDYKKKLLLEEIINKINIDKKGNVEIIYAIPLHEFVKTGNELAVSKEVMLLDGVSDTTTPKNITDLYTNEPLLQKGFNEFDPNNFDNWTEEIYFLARSRFKEYLIGSTLKFTENGRINAWQLANKTGISHYTARAYFNYSHFPTEEKMIQVLKPFNSNPENFIKFLNLENYIDSNLLFRIVNVVNKKLRDEKIGEEKILEEIKKRVEKYKLENTLNRAIIYSEQE